MLVFGRVYVHTKWITPPKTSICTIFYPSHKVALKHLNLNPFGYTVIRNELLNTWTKSLTKTIAEVKVQKSNCSEIICNIPDETVEMKAGPILESNGMRAIFRKMAKKGKKIDRKGQKRAKYLKIWAKCTKFENILKKGGWLRTIIAHIKPLK